MPIVLFCLALGVWQVQRLHWKEGLIAERDAAVAAPPAPRSRAAAAGADTEFRHVAAEGIFLNDKEISSPRPRRAAPAIR